MKTGTTILFAWLLLTARSMAVIVHVPIPEDQQAFLGLDDPVFRDFDFDQDGRQYLISSEVEAGRKPLGANAPPPHTSPGPAARDTATATH